MEVFSCQILFTVHSKVSNTSISQTVVLLAAHCRTLHKPETRLASPSHTNLQPGEDAETSGRSSGASQKTHLLPQLEDIQAEEKQHLDLKSNKEKPAEKCRFYD